MITVKHLFFSYRPEQKLLSGLSFSIKKGEFVALLGANGAGKSTLLKLLLGQLEPQKGKCTIEGRDPRDKALWGKIGYVPQKLSIDPTHPAKVRELVKDTSLCEHLDIVPLFEKQFHSLSGGQQQRVLVALALENNPDYIFLDEPTVGVDEQTRKKFYDLLKHLAVDHNKTIILVTHDSALVQKYTSRSLCIDTVHHFKEGVCIHD